jgi:hypothetical protein
MAGPTPRSGGRDPGRGPGGMAAAPPRRDSTPTMFSRPDDTTPPRHLPLGLMQVVRDRLVDKAFQLYLDWRDECEAVDAAYRRWRHAAGTESGFAFAVYTAALDREECAALHYRAALADGQRMLSGRGAWAAGR